LRVWARFISVNAIGAKIVAFLVQYAVFYTVFRTVVRRKLHEAAAGGPAIM